jgi:hypothetical protein
MIMGRGYPCSSGATPRGLAMISNPLINRFHPVREPSRTDRERWRRLMRMQEDHNRVLDLREKLASAKPLRELMKAGGR